MQPKTSAFRRCHVCGTICEAPAQVLKCESCGKPFAPFYYFNDQFTPIANEGNLRPMDLTGEWRPIQGLTAYWSFD
jgi:hypothetical protein